MRSARPKPLHVLCGRPMLLHVLDALAELPIDRTVVVVGHEAEWITKTLQEHAPPNLTVDVVEQRVARGTGDAASAALTAFPDDDLEDGDILVLPGDTPLVRPQTLADLVNRHRASDAAATVLTTRVPNPAGRGHVVRDRNEQVARIVDDIDADREERAIDEINTSIYCFRRSLLAPALRRLSPENAQGEYFLSDIPEVLHDAGYPVFAHEASDPMEIAGVNDRLQLAAVEAELRRRTNERWLRGGVTMLDPERTYIDATVSLGDDVTLFPGTLLQGQTVLGAGAQTGPDTRLVDCMVGKRAIVEKTVARDAEIGPDAVVGPFAHLAPGSHISPGAHTGPFYTSTKGDEGDQGD